MIITNWIINTDAHSASRQSQLIEDYKNSLDDWGDFSGTRIKRILLDLATDIITKKEATLLIQEIIKYYMDKIGASKIAKSSDGLELVISRNFADWFMCSTAESWSSCLNFESEFPYWSGLPGLIVDSSRVLAYITDGQRKSAYGIEVDKFISRTWIIQDREDVFNHLRWYPSKMFKNKILRRYSKLRVPEFREHDWISKLPLDLLYHKDKIGSCFIYQDMSDWHIRENEVYIIGSDEGCFSFIEEGKYPTIIEEDHFNYEDGLQELIDNNKEIINIDKFRCYECGTRLNEDEVFSSEYENYCEDCYNASE